MVIPAILIIILFAAKITIYALTPGGTTAGHEFVVAFPDVLNSESNDSAQIIGSIRVSTEEHFAFVQLHLPFTKETDKRCISPTYEIVPKVIKQYNMVSFDIDRSYSLQQNGIHCSLLIKASVPVRAWAVVFSDGIHHDPDQAVDTTDQFSEAFKLIPRRSSRMYYHISTHVGYPFVMVMSFDSQVTNIEIRVKGHTAPARHIFDKSEEQCSDEQECLTKTLSKIKLYKYSVWYFNVMSILSDLQGIEVEADHPVFVVSGNLKCRDTEEDATSLDVCASAVSPVECWGKEMIIPTLPKSLSITNRKILIRINALKFPLVINATSISASGGSKTLLQFNVHGSMWEKRLVLENPYIMRSTNNFQLSIFAFIYLDDNADGKKFATAFDIIPMNQWLRGHSFETITDKRHFEMNDQLMIISSVDPTNIGRKSGQTVTDIYNDARWSYYKYTDHFGKEKDGESHAAYIKYVKNPWETVYYINDNLDGRLMYYYLTLPTTHGQTFTMIAWDYYMAKLVGCVERTAEDIYDDGIDNDCDGQIDEEYKNEKDDDGDDLIDEDYQSYYNEHMEWADWTGVCGGNFDFGIKIRVRSCSVHIISRFGKYCEGLSMTCDDRVCTDEEMALHEYQISACLCRRGCADCADDGKQNLTDHRRLCWSCKPNYYPGDLCIKSNECPKGRFGKSCMDIRYQDMEKFKGLGSENDALAYIIVYLAAGVAVVIVGIVVVAMYAKRKREKEKQARKKEERASRELRRSSQLHARDKERRKTATEADLEVIRKWLPSIDFEDIGSTPESDSREYQHDDDFEYEYDF